MKTNRRLLSALLAIVMIVTMMPTGLVAFAADENTYEISTADELVAFAKAFNDGTLATNYTTVVLTDDIDMSAVTEWTPIGSSSKKFGLIFDGQGHMIKNLTATGTTDADEGGIFGYVSGTVQNLAVVDSSFTYTAKVGAIAANVSGAIDQCAVYNTSVSIINDSDSLHVNRAGGITGFLNGGTITESYSKADIYISDDYGVNYAGGIAAYAQTDAIIINSYYAGNMASVAGVYNVAGGIVGRSFAISVANCYVAGLVTGDISGAIVGWANNDTKLTNNYYYSDSNLYEYQKNAEDNFAGTAGNAVATAADLTADMLNGDTGSAFVANGTARTDGYTFPLLANNVFDDVADDSPAEDTENFDGGRGTLFAPYIISTKEQLENISKDLNAAYILNADITFGADEEFTPIGTAIKPFCGSFDGNGKVIRGLTINSTSDNAAMFIYNFGVIKNFTVTEVEAADPDPAIPSTVTVNTAEAKVNAATVAAVNYGRISNVTAEANVKVTSSQYAVNAAGITAVNYGVVENCKNTGNIFVDNSAVINDTTPNYKTVYEKASVNVAGLVAVNNASGSVSGSSSDTSRSLLTSAPNTNGINQGQFVALNNGGKINSTANAEAKYGAFAFSMTANTAHRGSGQYTVDNPVDFTGCTASYNGTAITDEPEDAYSDLVDNYQKISLTYTYDSQDYNVIFIAWLDYANVTMDATNVKKSYLLGENFSTSGLVVTGETADAQVVTLNKVQSADANGYTVELLDGDTPVEDLSTVSFSGSQHDYTVNVSYYGTLVGSYTITVYGIKTLSITTDTETYLSGVTPSFKVQAVYGDPSNTTKKITSKNYTFAIDTDKDPSAVTSYVSQADIDAGTSTAPTFPGAGTYYIYVKSGDVYGKSEPLTVIDSSAKVSNLKATIGSAGNDIECDNVQLSWSYENAGKAGVTFKVQRIEQIDLSSLVGKISDEDYLALVNNLVWKTLKSGVTETTYTDTKAEAGTTYKYRVVVVVSDESCVDDDATTITDIEPATPSSFNVVAPTGKDKYYALGDEIGHKGLTVNAIYANGSTESIKYSDKQTKNVIEYYLDSSNFDSSKAGTYTIKVMHCSKSSLLDLFTKYTEIGSYEVQVINPTNIKFVKSEYNIYPEGYSVNNFKNTLTVKLDYLNPENPSERIETQTLEDKSGLTITGYDSSSLNVEQTVNIKYSKCTDDADGYDIKIAFVKSVAPDKVVAEAQTDGTIDLEWTRVPGAASYNIYRSTSESGTYELVATKKSTASIEVAEGATVTGTDESETLESGKTYYYKVEGVIADQATAKSPASNAVTTAVPESYTIDVGGAKTAFAVGDKFTTRGVDVIANYKTGGTDEDPEYTAVKLKSRKYTATCSPAADAEGHLATAGTYQVTITINDNPGKTVTYADGTTPTGLNYYEITAYDVAAIQATVKKDAYPLNYDFTKADIKLKAIYGANIGAEDGSEVIAKRKTIKADDEGYVMTVAPDTSTTGKKTATVTYGGFTANVTVNVYNPDATVAVKGHANDDLTASLVIDVSAVDFVDKYTIVRSTSYDMDENLKTVTVSEGSKTVTIQDTFMTYKDSNVDPDTTYYYTVTPKFLDGAVGTSSAFVQITTLTEEEKMVITPEDGVGVTRSENMLIVDAPAVGGIDVEDFLNDYLTNDAVQMQVTKDGTPLTEGYISTGCTIKLYAATDTTYTDSKDTVTVVVLGDVSGDGKISSADYVLIKKEIMGTPIVGDANRKAADISLDGKISSADYVKVKKIIMAR